MEQYLKTLPFFLIAASIGIVASFLFVSKEESITKMRIVKEIFGGFWISSLAYIFLDQWTKWPDIVLFAITSIASFLNSRLISILRKDVMDGLAVNSKRALRNLADRLKKNNDYGGGYGGGYDDNEDCDNDNYNRNNNPDNL